MMPKTFKTFDEYLEFYKLDSPKPRGSKWYRIGADAAKKAAEALLRSPEGIRLSSAEVLAEGKGSG